MNDKGNNNVKEINQNFSLIGNKSFIIIESRDIYQSSAIKIYNSNDFLEKASWFIVHEISWLVFGITRELNENLSLWENYFSYKVCEDMEICRTNRLGQSKIPSRKIEL